jgi:sugar O-acyltransferase (sialic acid O-acetyltransferase NeuD family)
MRDLVILGTEVHACEMVEIVERVNRLEPTWRLRGYIARSEEHPSGDLNGYPVLGTLEALRKHPDACLVPVEGFPKSPDIPAERLVSLIDPGTFVSRTARIGPGAVIYPNCYVGLRAVIGAWFFCLSGSIVNHDCVIGDQVTICSGVRLAGHVRVEESCYLGQGCNIRQYLTIGAHSLVGMGSVVLKDVPPESVMVGSPARRLRQRIGDER